MPEQRASVDEAGRVRARLNDMNLVLPEWLDQVPGVDFTPEKELLTHLEEWASQNDWEVSDGSSLLRELSRRTDLLLSQADQERHMRVAVLPKERRGPGRIRIDATSDRVFSHRIFDLVHVPKQGRWRVELATLPLIEDIRKEGWDRLVELAFRT
jgi:hypothetical protein